ncbi:MAG: class I SAM-dependent methyltransferase [Azonexaceae bacterium]|nr:class I SAM-dependent methyltransferase [Azonexaceae bacterium]
MNAYRRRIWQEFCVLIKKIDTPAKILDFGCGDGWFASRLQGCFSRAFLVPLDVKRRERLVIEPVIFSAGEKLPFNDGDFDLVYAVDVLHHCHSPEFYLDELSRVSRRYILIKDHTWQRRWEFWALAILDELGNRRFGIPSPQHYQYSNDWSEFLGARGWRLSQMIHPCRCHVGILGALTNRLQYIALYERVELPSDETKLQSR